MVSIEDSIGQTACGPEALGHSVQDVPKETRTKTVIYSKGHKAKGHWDETRGLEDEAIEIIKTRAHIR